jgi:hypothetical protein
MTVRTTGNSTPEFRLLIHRLWRLHSERCDCRATDGRCGMARAIKSLDSAMKDVDAHLRGRLADEWEKAGLSDEEPSVE